MDVLTIDAVRRFNPNAPTVDMARTRILNWHAEKSAEQPLQESLPWREFSVCTSSVLVGELLLGRFKADLARLYYFKFVNAFPRWDRIANSTIKQLCFSLPKTGIWRRRAITLLHLAKMRAEYEHQPPSSESIARLPGMGQHSADLVQSIVFGQPTLWHGANVNRVFKRLFGDEFGTAGRPLDSSRLAQIAKTIVQHPEHVRLNWAINLFGTTVCTRDTPSCGQCILRSLCATTQNNPQS